MYIKDFFKFIKYYGKGKKAGLVGFVILFVIAGCLEFIGIGILYPFILMVVNPDIVVTTSYYERFASILGVQDVLVSTFLIGFLAITMFVVKNLMMILCLYNQNKFITKWKNDINVLIMKYYLYIPYKNILSTSVSEKIYTLTALSMQVLEVFVMRYLVFLTNIIVIGIIIVFLSVCLPYIVPPMLIFLSGSFLILNKVFKSKTTRLSNIQVQASVANNNQVIENITNLKEIRICNAEDKFFHKYQKTQRLCNDVTFKSNFYSAIPPYIMEIITVVTVMMFTVMIVMKNVGHPNQIIAWCTVFVASIFRMSPAMNKMQISINQMNSSKSLIKKINEEYEINRFDMVEVSEQGSEMVFEKRIELEHVSFSYNDNEPAIKDLSMTIEKGVFLGIVGTSGAGKSTLADIIMGLLPVDSGTIKVDGVEITNKNTFALRKLIGYVPQQVHLLEGSFKENVAWGLNNDEIDEDRVVEVLKQAQLYDFVMLQNGGINALAFGNSTGLSAGQKQRLLIARALYNNPQILIFDEATSSLDVATEYEITQVLTNVKGHKTIIVIAHRLSTLKSCDKLIFLKDGKIKACGSFDEISAQNPEFEKLIKLSKL